MPAAAAVPLTGQHPGLALPVPAGAASSPDDLPTWHVSINDVPIGPIRLEEMAHKIDAGAVSEYSLVWRVGLDDWRPLATVPELVALLHERRHSGPPSRSTFSSMPPFVETRAPLVERSARPAAPFPPSRFPALASVDPDDEIFPLADSLQPETSEMGLDDVSQPAASIGPEGIFQSSPQLGSYSGLPPTPDQEVSVPSAPPETAAVTAEPKRGLSLGIAALLIALIVFAGVAAFLAFERYGDELLKKWVSTERPARSSAVVQPSSEPAAAAAARTEEEPEVAPPEMALAVDEGAVAEADDTTENTEALADAQVETEVADANGLVPPPDPRDDTPKIAPVARSQPKPRRRSRPAPAPADEVEVAPENELSAAEQKILDQFQSGSSAAPARIDLDKAANKESDEPALDGDAIRSTVTANKPKLQRCYERAIRGQPSSGSARLDVSVMVASSGRVKSVSADGEGPGGLAACVEASVRRWRFPASAEGGPARFPIVFSAN